ncbi:methyltransferase family protein [Thalassovita sp.]|uniref:methyltransferase family protein n=1 Tax=Thalassovita sp. TaxID=1979401 RepID=UPI003B5C8225
MLKWIDIPPAWLLLAAVIAWIQGTYFPAGLSFGGYWADFVGGILVGGGILLMLLAVFEMRKHRTTVIPHRDADTMVTSGIFSRSRNPIYLGDVVLLAGLVLRFDAVLSLPLVPLLLWLLEKRFVIPEENRLRIKFRANFARYCQKTRRWI